MLAALGRIVTATARYPLALGTAPDRYRIDDTQVPFVFLQGVSDDTDQARAEFGEFIAVLAKAAAGEPTRVSPRFVSVLRPLVTGDDECTGAQAAVLCGDKPAPRDPERYWEDVRCSRAEQPLFGPLVDNIGVCSFWGRPRERPTQVRHGAPALIVAATGDPRTTYRSSVALHGLLSGSPLLTVKGTNRHGLYGEYGNACVDAKVNRYLATGTLPPADETCPSRAER
ncbi:alpha/beta hydrolase [Streptomyces sp. NRRL F-5755]|uniref:alpha/beta hydrolase n=1 Tax=Streptomyces sp. NRRL F-5755 TaxID=1519475 RepID=UPI0006ADBE8D|nr:alpha/beta hydrolase [Streptomyces sp. NRRL F-5755]